MFNLSSLDSIPVLPKRENCTDKFSTYLEQNNLYGRLVLQWKTQPHLKRNINLYIAQYQECSKLSFQQNTSVSLAQFWRNLALEKLQIEAEWEPRNKNQLACEHLASYFEEKCYWVAKQLCKEDNQNAWDECLCSARLIIYNPLKLKNILAKYDSKKASLETFVANILEHTVKFEINTQRFSFWRVLCKKSDKELKEALQVYGRVEPDISKLIFARKYFKQVYLVSKINNPKRKCGQKWVEPDDEDFEKAARCYNAERILPSAPHEVATSTNITSKEIKAWLETCISALTNYPKSIVPYFSLEALQESGREVESNIYELEFELELQTSQTEVEVTGINSLFQNTNSALINQLKMLKVEQQKLLLLYYGLGLNQQQLAIYLGINQSSISRYLAKSTVQFLEAIAEISQPDKWVEPYIMQWLKRSYTAPCNSDLIQAALVSAIKKLPALDREVLQLSYAQNLDESKIYQQLNLDANKVKEVLSQIKQNLQASLLKEINTWTKKYIEVRLQKYYKLQVNLIRKKIFQSTDTLLERQEEINAIVDAYFSEKAH